MNAPITPSSSQGIHETVVTTLGSPTQATIKGDRLKETAATEAPAQLAPRRLESSNTPIPAHARCSQARSAIASAVGRCKTPATMCGG